MENLQKLTFLSLIALLGFSATSCRKQYSQKTGWEYNNSKNGGFTLVPYVEQETGPGLVLVEGGTFTMGQVEQDVMYDHNNYKRRVTVSSFYMDQTEITNQDWLDYVTWTSYIYGQSYPEIVRSTLPDTLVWRSPLAYMEDKVEYYLRHPAYRDYPVVGVNWVQATNYAKWRTDRVNEFILKREGILEDDPGIPDDPFNTDAYFAGQYQQNLTDKQLKDYKHSLYGGTGQRAVRMEDGILLPSFRLPTEAEWEFAAYSLIGNSVNEMIDNRKIYPWTGHYVRDPEKKYRGEMLGNFVRGRGDYMGVAGALNDNADVTAPVVSYLPNDYGLYNMGGNVSEWVMDVYRPISPEDVNEFQSFRGNVYKTKIKDAEGILADKYDYIVYDLRGIRRFLDEFFDISGGGKTHAYEDPNDLDIVDGERNDQREYEDKLSSQSHVNRSTLTDAEKRLVEDMIAATDEAIKIKEEDRQEAEAMDRMQEAIDEIIKGADPEVFIAPKVLAGIYAYVQDSPGNMKWRSVTMEENLDRRNYRYSDNIGIMDGDVESSIYYASEEIDNNLPMYQSGKRLNMTLTTLINDRARVYKGGSWKDRAYYVGPGTRRFLDERQAKDYIGFRCTMTRVGSPRGLNQKKRKKK